MRTLPDRLPLTRPPLVHAGKYHQNRLENGPNRGHCVRHIRQPRSGRQGLRGGPRLSSPFFAAGIRALVLFWFG